MLQLYSAIRKGDTIPCYQTLAESRTDFANQMCRDLRINIADMANDYDFVVASPSSVQSVPTVQ